MNTDDRIRQRAWLGLLDADRETLYLSFLANKMRRVHRITSTIVAVGSIAALASFVAGVSGVGGVPQAGTVGLQSGVVGSAISLMVAVVAIWSMVSDYSRKAVIATSLSSECSEMASKWRRLWIELGDLGDDEALKRVEDLERSDREITKWVPHDLGINCWLNSTRAAGRSPRPARVIRRHVMANGLISIPVDSAPKPIPRPPKPRPPSPPPPEPMPVP